MAAGEHVVLRSEIVVESAFNVTGHRNIAGAGNAVELEGQATVLLGVQIGAGSVEKLEGI